MNKMWFVALNEYKRHVLRKNFIWALLSVPIMIVVAVGAGYLASTLEDNPDPIGYVDEAGILTESQPIPEDAGSSTPVEILAYPDQDTAQAALDDGDIQAYYVIAADYQETHAATLVYYEEPGGNAEAHFWDFVRVNLVSGLSEDVAYLALEDADVVIRTPDNTREFSEKNALNFALPVVTGFIFIFLMMTGSGYLGAAVAEEKENRTMEILATSMSANQFIAGKIFGIVCISLTQLVFWLLVIVVVLQVGGNVMNIPWLDVSNIKLTPVFQLILILLPAYVMYAALMVAASSSVAEASEAQQLMGIFSLPLGFSYWFAAVIIENPNSLISTIASIFPFTAPTMMSVRSAFAIIPLEQLLLCIGLTTLFAAFSIWIAARAYELGMLRYGQKLKFKELFMKNNRGGK